MISGVIRRLVFGEPITEDYQIVDESVYKELKKQAKKESKPLATQKHLDSSRKIDDMVRMPELVVLGLNTEFLMYCKTCVELQKMVADKKLKVAFVKSRGENFLKRKGLIIMAAQIRFFRRVLQSFVHETNVERERVSRGAGGLQSDHVWAVREGGGHERVHGEHAQLAAGQQPGARHRIPLRLTTT